MNLTCKCGASIAIDDKHPCPILAAHDFRLAHKSCRAIDADFVLSTIRQAYSELLKMPMGSERLRLDGTLARLRDAIADAEGRDAEDVQNEYESKTAASTIRARMPCCKKCGSLLLVARVVPHIAADLNVAKGIVRCQECGYEEPSDPYQRFREAIRDGKRVFRVHAAGTTGIVMASYLHLWAADCLNVEGIDIPMQPTPEWLDRNGVELTGECRVPDLWELWASADLSGVMGESCADLAFISDFSGRRWIVRKKAAPPVICHRCNLNYAKSRYFCCESCLEEIKITGLVPSAKTDSIAAHAAEHDAIVRNLLMDAIHQTIPEHVATKYERKIQMLGDQVLSPLQPSRRVGQDAPPQEVIECKGARPVNLHIGQSATDIVKQARDLVQGMGITKKTKYCAFNIVGSELIWGIK